MKKPLPRSCLRPFTGLALFLATLHAGCSDAPCEETLTCDVGESGSTTTGTGGASSSSSSQTTTTGGGGGGVDTTPPTIVSVTPSVDAIGVSDSATILVSFSEPMNRVAIQNAFQSDDLTGLSFSWPDDQTMEVTPGNLAYAQGGHDVMANQYSYTVTTLAADLAGNQLANGESWSFSTLRSVTDFVVGSEGTTNFVDNGHCFSFPTSRLGRVLGSSHNDCRAFITFDLSPIPAGAQLTAASLTCSYLSVVGATPTSSVLSRINFDSNDPVSGWGATALDSYSDPFNFAQPTAIENPFTLDVLTALQAELAGTTPTSIQFRMSLSHPAAITDSYLNFRNTSSGGCRNGFQVSYLAP